MSHERGRDPGHLSTIDLSHVTGASSLRHTMVVGLALAAAILAGLVGFVSASSSPKPHCPDGYALAGGGFAGALHCTAGTEVEWR